MYVDANLLVKVVNVIARDKRRPNGDSFSDAIHELYENGQLTREEYIQMDAFRALVDYSELPIL